MARHTQSGRAVVQDASSCFTKKPEIELQMISDGVLPQWALRSRQASNSLMQKPDFVRLAVSFPARVLSTESIELHNQFKEYAAVAFHNPAFSSALG